MEWLEEKIAQEFGKNKWEGKTIEEIALNLFKGNDSVNYSSSNKGNFSAIIAYDVAGAGICINESKLWVHESLQQGKPLIENGDLLIICQGFNQELLGHSCVYTGKRPCIAGNNMCVLKHAQNPKYLAYSMSSSNVRKQIRWLCKGGSRPYIYKEELKKIKILLPDIETQNRIVEFLDKFIDLEHKLKKEMEKRDGKKRYPIWVLQRANSQYRNF